MSSSRWELKSFDELGPGFVGRLIEALPCGVYLFDVRTTRFALVDRHVARMLGHDDTADVSRLSAADLLHPEDVERLPVLLARWDRVPDDRILETEYRMRHADGTYRWFSSRDRVFERAAGRPTLLLGTLVDVTEKKRLREELRHAQKLEAVGRLAGGVAHDFNNVLTAMIGHAQLAQMAVEEAGDVAPHLEAIMTAAMYAADVTSQLLSFARQRVAQPRQVLVDRAVEDVLGLLRRLIGEISLDWEPGADCAARVDRGQLTQILVNLVVNARDAMPDGGAVRLATAAVSVPHDPTPGVELAPGDYVRLSVEDEGRGMTPQTLERIFEPFFTTKAETGGTGLGLATVYGIVQASGGGVAVASDPGGGSRFDVYLPVATEATLPEPLPPPFGPLPRSLRVLVVEDAAEVREVVRSTLERTGGQVTAVGDGAAACAVIDAAVDAFDLLVTDVVLPERSCTQVVERFQSRWPSARILYVSGFAAPGGEADIPSQAFLQKPFTPALLRERVRALCGDGSAAAR